jgi:hypothetical protein
MQVPRGRKLASRRVWALDVLRVHVEAEGVCGFCASKYGHEHPWPCVPARIALLYIGQPKQLRPEGPAGDLTS